MVIHHWEQIWGKQTRTSNQHPCAGCNLQLCRLQGTWRYRQWQKRSNLVCNPGFQCCPVKTTIQTCLHTPYYNMSIETDLAQLEDVHVNHIVMGLLTVSVLTWGITFRSVRPMGGLSVVWWLTVDLRKPPATTNNMQTAKSCFLLRLCNILSLLTVRGHTWEGVAAVGKRLNCCSLAPVGLSVELLW